MKNTSLSTQTAHNNARSKGIVPRWFVWITVRDYDTNVEFSRGFWTGDRPITLHVIDGSSGVPVQRTYYGNVNLEVGDIPRVSNLVIESTPISMSAIPDLTKEMLLGYNAHLAKVEVHAGTLDTDTRAFVDPPEVELLGIVDEAPIEIAGKGDASTIRFTVVSELLMALSRPSTRTRSYEGQKQRAGDEFGYYSSTVMTWNVFWGVTKPNGGRGNPSGSGGFAG